MSRVNVSPPRAASLLAVLAGAASRFSTTSSCDFHPEAIGRLAELRAVDEQPEQLVALRPEAGALLVGEGLALALGLLSGSVRPSLELLSCGSPRRRRGRRLCRRLRRTRRAAPRRARRRLAATRRGMLAQMKRVVLIVNPFRERGHRGAGPRGRARAVRSPPCARSYRAARARDRARARGGGRGRADRLLGRRRLQRGPERRRSGVPLGFLPGGGTSVLPRALGLPRNPVAAAERRRRRSEQGARAGSRSDA